MIIKFIRQWIGSLRYSTAILITFIYVICMPKDGMTSAAYMSAMITFIISEHAKPSNTGV